MTTRRNRMAEAERRARRQLETALDDIHERRLSSGLRQSDLSSALGCTRQWVSVVERGRVRDLGVIELGRLGASVGLDISVKAYAGQSVLRDAGQVALLNRFHEAIGDGFRWRPEAMVAPGDQRAFDVLLGLPPRCAAVEALTRLRDVQSQIRSVMAKQETARIAVLILVIAATHTNRRALREAGAVLREAFPLSTRAVLGSLRRGEIPGANGIVLI